MEPGVTVRDLDGLAEWTAASALYRSVFGYTHPEYGVSPRLLAALRANSGSVLGAFARDGRLVGFCYGFTAVDDGEIYHYSQAAVVDPAAQGTGVGRLLKQAQATAARATGARTMRWTFDPYALRNAHFNLAVLGAAGIRFLPDHYGDGTDRLLVSWPLAEPRSPAPEPATVVTAPATDREAAPDPAARELLRHELTEAFRAGGQLVDVRGTDRPGRVAYVFGSVR